MDGGLYACAVFLPELLFGLSGDVWWWGEGFVCPFGEFPDVFGCDDVVGWL